MGFSRQEYWSGLPFPSPGDLPDPGIKPRSPALQADALTSEPPGNPKPVVKYMLKIHVEKISGVRATYFSPNCCLVAKSCLTLYDLLDGSMPGSSAFYCLQHESSNSYLLSWWHYLTMSSSVAPFSFCLQSFWASESFPVSRLFIKGVELHIQQQSFQWLFRVDFLQNWLVWSPCSCKGPSRVFSSTTVRKHKFFYGQPSLRSNSHICTWLLGKL